MKNTFRITALAAAIALAGCGGGGGNVNDNPGGDPGGVRPWVCTEKSTNMDFCTVKETDDGIEAEIDSGKMKEIGEQGEFDPSQHVRAFGDTYKITLTDPDGDGVYTWSLAGFHISLDTKTGYAEWWIDETEAGEKFLENFVKALDTENAIEGSGVVNMTNPDADENTDPGPDLAEWQVLETNKVETILDTIVEKENDDGRGNYDEVTYNIVETGTSTLYLCTVEVVGDPDTPAATCDGFADDETKTVDDTTEEKVEVSRVEVKDEVDTAQWSEWVYGEIIDGTVSSYVDYSLPDADGQITVTTTTHTEQYRNGERTCEITVNGFADVPAPVCEGENQTVEMLDPKVEVVVTTEQQNESNIVDTPIGSLDLTEGNKTLENNANHYLGTNTEYNSYNSRIFDLSNHLTSSAGILEKGLGLSAIHQQGWTGEGSTIMIEDEFYSSYSHQPWEYPLNGAQALDGNYKYGDSTHGEVVSLFAKTVAPGAKITYLNTNNQFVSTSPDATRDEVDAINWSWGWDAHESSGTVDVNAINNAADVLNNRLSQYQNSVLTIAAGNVGDGEYPKVDDYDAFGYSMACSIGVDKGNCDTITKIDEIGKVIFVGAISTGSSIAGVDELEYYSQEAGNLKDHFIVTYDDYNVEGDASGTSFAAPTVAGAVAVITQKFPNLTPEDKKLVILHTADDLGDSGVDEIYGHGKLNLGKALSPVGNIH